jgi:hypothetical protein
MAIVLLARVALAAAQPIAPKLETLCLEDGNTAGTWGAEEATVSTSDKFGEHGGTSMLFHIDVNWQTGEANYPIGWPRMHKALPEDQHNWSGWDFLELVIHSETSRDALPKDPLGLILHTPDRAHEWDRSLRELRKGETVKLVIPLSEIPRHNDVRLVQFFISESNYRDGDTVEFTFDDLSLTRYAEPTVSGAQVLSAIAYDDVTALGASFRLLGVPLGQKVTLHARARQGQQVLGDLAVPLPRGEHEVFIPLSARPAPGEVVLELTLPKPTAVGKVRIVPSPFAAKGGN